MKNLRKKVKRKNSEPKRQAKAKVLIVDDEPDICLSISSYLDKRGFATESAHDGKEALKALKTKRPDLIILDVIMPKMDGFEVLKRLKSHPAYSKIPIIILTVKSESENLDKGIRLKADFYLPKPFSFENLKEFITLCLTGRNVEL